MNSAVVSKTQNGVVYDWDERLREWFINDERGLEQGWTIRERPVKAGSGTGPLTLTLQTRGTLQARIQPDGLEVAFTDSIRGTVLTYGGLKAWDADSKPLAVRFDSVAANDSGLRVVVEETGARYPIIIDPVAQQAYLKASNTEANDLFGWSVAISGDTVVVGTVGRTALLSGSMATRQTTPSLQAARPTFSCVAAMHRPSRPI